MGNHVKARPRNRPKPKSIKAKINRKMGSKRRRQRMGKELKKGEKGAAASFLTRAQVLRRLQISLRDFRRLCILKGIYPRDPSKKASGKDKTYYHIKDVSYLAHEPVLESFREFKAFMRKIRRSIGRKDIKEAQRKELYERPTYKLDHLVRERYPRFLDAVRDLDDALCLVHLFACLPQMRERTSAHTEVCKRLVKEWAFYVSRSKCLSKVFVSIKGVYFQAEVLGQPVTWVMPHMFTTTSPTDVDFSIMYTFLEFYENLLKFAMFKLFHSLDLRYPPSLHRDLDGLDGGLATLKTKDFSQGDVEEDGDGDEEDEDEETEESVLPSTKEQRRAAKKKLREEEKKLRKQATKAKAKSQAETTKLKSLEAKLGEITKADKEAAAEAATVSAGAREEGGAGDSEKRPSAVAVGMDEEDQELGDALTGPLEEAFMSRTEEGEEILANDVAAEEERRKRLFRGLKFFFGREVPKSWMELVVMSCGGVVGWEGEGSPLSASDTSITHQVVDRPTAPGVFHKNREYVQPQWILDSLNARLLLPVARYAPGIALPPHLSPFVDDASVGYIPAYREELDKLQSAAASRRKGVVATEGGDGYGDGDGRGNQMEMDVEGKTIGGGDENNGDEKAAANFARDLELERAGKSFSQAKEGDEDEDEDGEEEGEGEGDEEDEDGDEDLEDEDDEDGDEDEDGQGGEKEEEDAVASVPEKQTEEEEHKELSRMMMSKKAKRLYGRMQHGIGKRREEVERLKAKRRKLEAQYESTANMASSSKTQKKKRKLKKRRAAEEARVAKDQQ